MQPAQPLDILFPIGGMDVSRSFNEQTASVAPLGQMYDPSFQTQKFETTRSGINVRGFDPLQNRFRGGSRPGLTKYISTQVNTTSPIQALGFMQKTGSSPPSGSTQPSTSGLLNYLVAVSGGTIKFTFAGASAWFTPTGGTAALSSTGVIAMAALNQVMYFTDGSNYKKWTPATGAVGTVATWAGVGQATVPIYAAVNPPGSGANKGRLMTVWRGRVVISGCNGDSQNIWFSGIANALNWDTKPTTIVATQAVALNPAAANPSAFGQTFDEVTALAPINDDNLFIGCAGSCFLLRGDPMAGGQLQCLEPGIGVQFGNAWCRDSEGVLYFVSNRLGIYAFSQFDYPRLISQRIDPLLQKLATGTNTVSMVWDDWMRGFHLFFTTTASPTTSTTHYFWEKRTGAWWQDTVPGNMNPLCCTTFDGNNPADRRVMLGCNDGYLRYSDFSATTDDGTAIASSVVLGPIVAKFAQLMVKELRGELDTAAGQVTWQLYGGTTPQGALSTTPVASGAWSSALNAIQYIRRSAKSFYLKLSATTPWAAEKIQISVANLGMVRQRGNV